MALEYNSKGMPFRRLGPSGLRVPLFSLVGCKCYLIMNRATTPNVLFRFVIGLTLGGTVKGDPVKVCTEDASPAL